MTRQFYLILPDGTNDRFAVQALAAALKFEAEVGARSPLTASVDRFFVYAVDGIIAVRTVGEDGSVEVGPMAPGGEA